MVLLRSLPASVSRVALPSMMVAVAAMLDQSTRRPSLTGLLMAAFS